MVDDPPVVGRGGAPGPIIGAIVGGVCCIVDRPPPGSTGVRLVVTGTAPGEVTVEDEPIVEAGGCAPSVRLTSSPSRPRITMEYPVGDFSSGIVIERVPGPTS